MKTDPLTNPVIPPWMLNQMDLGPKYERTEQLLDWLTRWSGRNHGIGSKVIFHYFILAEIALLPVRVCIFGHCLQLSATGITA